MRRYSITFNLLLFIILSVVFIIIANLQLSNLGGVLPVARYYLIWILWGTILFLALLKVAKSKSFLYSHFTKYYFIYILLIISTAFFNPILNPELLKYYSFWLIAGFLLYISLMQFTLTLREESFLLLILLLSALIESLFATMQFFGLYREIPFVPQFIDGIVGGAFQEKGLLGSYIASGLVISLYLLSLSDLFYREWKRFKIVFFAIIFILALSLVLAISKVAIIGTFCGGAVLVLSQRRSFLNIKKYFAIWIFFFLAGMVAGNYFLGIQDLLGIRTVERNQIAWWMDTGNTSYRPRLLMYRVSMDMLRENPLIGVGFANFASRYQYKQAEYMAKYPAVQEYMPQGFVTHPHSTIFMIIAECGVVGIISIIILLYGFVNTVKKGPKKQTVLYLALMLPLIIHALTAYPFRLSIIHYFTFIVMIFISTRHCVKTRMIRKKATFLPFIIATAFFIYTTFSLYMVFTFNAYMGLTRYVKTNGADDSGVKASLSNLFLKNWAVPIVMLTEINHQMMTKTLDDKSVNIFLDWSGAEKIRQPIRYIFSSEAELYYVLGKKSKNRTASLAYYIRATKDIDVGRFLYPTDRYLIKLEKKIANRVRDEFRYKAIHY